ncbi:MAG: flagellar basal-body rod protein FlgG [Sedimentisphaerales bacterium]|nr:flagellar basal-body rod protein FlgG [Sedimentisphaerales bacterium]
MLRAFSTASTGMMAQQMLVDVIANNLANVNTTGFKQSQIEFQDLLYARQKEAGTEVAPGINAPTGLEVGSGVRVASTLKIFSLGEFRNTGRNMDIAIRGEGFLRVLMPNGDIRYTRDGSLQVNANGQVVSMTGYTIEPAIVIPTDAASVDIGADGGINVTDQAGVRSVVGQIQLARFPNPSGLHSQGDNLFAPTDASGEEVVGIPAQDGFGAIQSGFLEKSNVQMVNELVNLITAQRAYEINSRAIRAGDEMLRETNNISR